MRTKIEHGGLRINSLRPPSLRDTPGALMPAKRRRDIATPTKLPIHRQQSLRCRNERLEMPVRMKLPVLPVYYYHDHFTKMLFFISEIYGPVLTERHRAFVETFKTLSKDAQCLLIRMINRRGRLFRHGAFRYAEIADTRSA